MTYKLKPDVADAARDLLHKLGGPVENMPLETVYRLLAGLRGLGLHLNPCNHSNRPIKRYRLRGCFYRRD